MAKYKVCVYTICKNEEQFVDRWMDSMSEADQIIVLDTGSTDSTVERLRARGAEVTVETISPWRFDAARNRSLELVPDDADICVCTDLDEVLRPGWRATLENAWTGEATRARYRYTWSFLPDGSEGHVFWPDKIHKNGVYRWVHPVHEVLEYTGANREHIVTVPGLQLDHHPDETKSRGQYLPLLELAVAEAPDDDRNMHYLGREYMFHRRWEDCIATLKRHLSLPRATWADERCASMRFIGRCYRQLGRDDLAAVWFLRAIAEAPHLREPYVDCAALLYDSQNWPGLVYMANCALAISERPATYITEAYAWGALPWDYLSIGLWHLGQAKEAAEAARKALTFAPQDTRLQNNLAIFERSLYNNDRNSPDTQR